MKNFVIILLVLALLGGGGYLVYEKLIKSNTLTTLETVSQKQTGGTIVDVKNFNFSPKIITIKAGESVTWTNSDLVGHTATADDDSWDTSLISNGESKIVKFDKKGTYTYHCTPHPFMKGTVIVE
ncbi:MAG: cupredoxin family copper-binding protein [Patescibacteria group bacterium]